MTDLVRIARAAQQLQPKLVEWRRAFHRYPELGYDLEQTGSLVSTRLEEFGYVVQRGVGRSGIVALRPGAPDRPVLAFRADMDALPIQEAGQCEFASTRPGYMHACGHDAHTAILLGVAAVLARQPGGATVKLIFQPSEEAPPSGARAMIADGVLSNPTVDAILGIHVDPELPVGSIGLKEGPMNAAVDDFTLVVRGRGGHAAHPHRSCDPIVAAAAVIMALQTAVSRHLSPFDPGVVTVGVVRGGTAPNVIPDAVELRGTIRTLDPTVRKALTSHVEQLASRVAAAFGATGEFTLEPGESVLWNSPALVERVRRVATEVLADDPVRQLARPVMGGDDFASFSAQVPGLMIRLGIRNETRGIKFPLHHPEFDLDEAALAVGVSVLVGAALTFEHSDIGA